jgi:DNA-binding HxlR family transcriptional regulator
MQRTSLEEMSCPVARALACVGEWWSLLILRDAFQGLSRFEDFRASLGISTNILARRLQHLTRNGILERRLYQRKPARYEYLLTEKGRDLLPLLLVLYRWGNEHQAPEGIAVELSDRLTRRRLQPVVVDRRSKVEITLDRVMFRPGPAAPRDIIERAELAATLRQAKASASNTRKQTVSIAPRTGNTRISPSQRKRSRS